MSRKGKLPIPVPKGVEITIKDTEVAVKGPKGTLTQKLIDGIVVTQENNEIIVSLHESAADKKNFHGLYRTLIDNMVVGTTQGFAKVLEMIGVGYRAAVQGNQLDLQIGYSHPTKLPIPAGIEVKVDKNTTITLSGANKQAIGQFAAVIRAMRPPEPYQGKGIRYKDEYVRRKAGKSASKK